MVINVDRPAIPDTSRILLNLVDGARRPLDGSVKPLVRLRDGSNQLLWTGVATGPELTFDVPFFDNFRDAYTVLVTADGYRDVGFFPVQATPSSPQVVDLMLVAHDYSINFLPWDQFKNQYAQAASFLCCAGDEQDVETRYSALEAERPLALASLLNLTAAMSAIHLPSKTPLDYFKQLIWDDTLAQDRFFGWADQSVVQQVQIAASQGFFAPEPNPGIFHQGATSSFKQIQFGEANVQLTFHENTTRLINGATCIVVEPDIDYYKDLGAHTLLEVVPNKFGHSLTDPVMVYVLRWVAGQRAGIPEFDPGYAITRTADATRTLTLQAGR